MLILCEDVLPDCLEVQVIFSFGLKLYGGNALQRSRKRIEKKECTDQLGEINFVRLEALKKVPHVVHVSRRMMIPSNT